MAQLKTRNPVVRQMAKSKKAGGKHQITTRKQERKEKGKYLSKT